MERVTKTPIVNPSLRSGQTVNGARVSPWGSASSGEIHPLGSDVVTVKVSVQGDASEEAPHLGSQALIPDAASSMQ